MSMRRKVVMLYKSNMLQPFIVAIACSASVLYVLLRIYVVTIIISSYHLEYLTFDGLGIQFLFIVVEVNLVFTFWFICVTTQ